MDEAVITSTIRYADADCIVRLFCREHGRISAFQRRGVSQAPSRARVDIQQPKSGSDLFRLKKIDIAPQTYLWARNLKTLGFVSYLLEITELFTPEHEAMPQLFDTLDAALSYLSTQSANPTLLRAYEIQLLSYCGYLPDLSEAVEGLDETALIVARDLSVSDLQVLPQVEEPVLRQVARIFMWQLREHAKGPLRSVEFLKNVGV